MPFVVMRTHENGNLVTDVEATQIWNTHQKQLQLTGENPVQAQEAFARQMNCATYTEALLKAGELARTGHPLEENTGRGGQRGKEEDNQRHI